MALHIQHFIDKTDEMIRETQSAIKEIDRVLSIGSNDCGEGCTHCSGECQISKPKTKQK